MVTVRGSSPNLVAQLAGLEVLVRANAIDLEHEARLQLQRVRVALQAVALDALDDLVRRAGTLFKHCLPGITDRTSLGVRKPVQRVQVDRVSAHDSVPFAVALEEAGIQVVDIGSLSLGLLSTFLGIVAWQNRRQ
uniref:(northern house mosquito) hypothetical protein n=1 Tax=Culex pipiens TaxID=7175 RepID=A0A8D8L698_CULPI